MTPLWGTKRHPTHVGVQWGRETEGIISADAVCRCSIKMKMGLIILSSPYCLCIIEVGGGLSGGKSGRNRDRQKKISFFFFEKEKGMKQITEENFIEFLQGISGKIVDSRYAVSVSIHDV